jgi:hypothetical protein
VLLAGRTSFIWVPGTASLHVLGYRRDTVGILNGSFNGPGLMTHRRDVDNRPPRHPRPWLRCQATNGWLRAFPVDSRTVCTDA